MKRQESLGGRRGVSRLSPARAFFTPEPDTSELSSSGPKRGEVLLYTPRRSSAPSTPATRDYPVVIRHGGRDFIATQEMADCFLSKALRVVDAHDAELVALLHLGGLELLFIADNIPFSVGSTFAHRPPVDRAY